jgi:hypothetical protein
MVPIMPKLAVALTYVVRQARECDRAKIGGEEAYREDSQRKMQYRTCDSKLKKEPLHHL